MTRYYLQVTNESLRRLGETFFEAMDSLDWYVKDNLRFILKAGYEQQIIRQYPSREWENLWIEKMKDSSKLVTTAICSRCGSYPITIDIPEQIYLVFYSLGENIKCSKCNKNMATISGKPDRPLSRASIEPTLPVA